MEIFQINTRQGWAQLLPAESCSVLSAAPVETEEAEQSKTGSEGGREAASAFPAQTE